MAAQYPFCGQEIPAPCEAATQRYSGSVNRHSDRLVPIQAAGRQGGGVLARSEAEVISQYYAWHRALMGITADGRPPGGDPAPLHPFG